MKRGVNERARARVYVTVRNRRGRLIEKRIMPSAAGYRDAHTAVVSASLLCVLLVAVTGKSLHRAT